MPIDGRKRKYFSMIPQNPNKMYLFAPRQATERAVAGTPEAQQARYGEPNSERERETGQKTRCRRRGEEGEIPLSLSSPPVSAPLFHWIALDWISHYLSRPWANAARPKP